MQFLRVAVILYKIRKFDSSSHFPSLFINYVLPVNDHEPKLAF